MNGFLPVGADGINIYFLIKKYIICIICQNLSTHKIHKTPQVKDKPLQQILWQTVDWRGRDACNGRHCSHFPLLRKYDFQKASVFLHWPLPDLLYCRSSPLKAPASQDKGGSALCQLQSCLSSQTSVCPRNHNNLPMLYYWKPYISIVNNEESDRKYIWSVWSWHA